MRMSEAIILQPVGIMRGPSEKGCQYYQFAAEDKSGVLYVMNFGSKLCYTSAIEKSFSRLIPFKPTPEGEQEHGPEPTI
jgi:hypothetical protein